MEIILITIFTLGYLAITLEHSLKIDKLIPALAMMSILWALISFFQLPVFNVDTILKNSNRLMSRKSYCIILVKLQKS